MTRLVGLIVLLSAGRALAQDVTAAARLGVYQDDDHTRVIRSMVAADATSGSWKISAREAVDLVSSASVDVRSSPFLDALSGASATAPTMNDRRTETTLGLAWADGHGRGLGVTAIYAEELDYTSIGGGLSGTYDLDDGVTTLLGGINVTSDRIYSQMDPSFDRALGETGWSLGVARVLTTDDAIRLRYDGDYLGGYQASPYRAVRFGPYTTALRPGGQGILFLGTIGGDNGVPENVPSVRVRHALVGEWVHALGDGLGLETKLRVALDSWGILGASAGAELRLAHGRWQARGGYRFYLQSAADFFQDRYVDAPSAYAYVTSDKELGAERGHAGSLDLAFAASRKLSLDARVEALYYQYPGFALLPARTSLFTEIGGRLEF